MSRAIPVFIATVAAAAILAVAVSMRAGDGLDVADQAWTDRLNGQAAAAQELARAERAEAAYRARLAAQADAYVEARAAQERARQAWTERLTALARESGFDVGMSGRVAAAWTARLDGLAEHLASED